MCLWKWNCIKYHWRIRSCILNEWRNLETETIQNLIISMPQRCFSILNDKGHCIWSTGGRFCFLVNWALKAFRTQKVYYSKLFGYTKFEFKSAYLPYVLLRRHICTPNFMILRICIREKLGKNSEALKAFHALHFSKQNRKIPHYNTLSFYCIRIAPSHSNT